MGGNIFYTTEAGACFIQLLFITQFLFFFFFFFYPFQTIHRSIKQTHFPVIIFHCVAERSKPPPLAWSHTHAMIKIFDLSSFHQFMGKPLTLRYAALCLHLTRVWPILNAAVHCSSEGYSCTLGWFDGLLCNKWTSYRANLLEKRRGWVKIVSKLAQLIDILWRLQKKKKKKKKKIGSRNISSSFQWETCGPPKTWSTHLWV